jgi:hypothetical protein
LHLEHGRCTLHQPERTWLANQQEHTNTVLNFKQPVIAQVV